MAATPAAASCPFCEPPKDRVLAQDEVVLALWDLYPISPGHALVIPRRHMPSLFDATEAERSALLAMVNTTKAIIDERHRPDGYNIGVNVGAAAGQTVFHLHIHVIPRFAGDVDDPRGGVRHVIPAKANYTLDSKDGSVPARGPLE